MADLHSSIIAHLARIEEKEKNRGYQHGLLLGKQTVLCEQLQHRFGAIPDGVIAEVMATIEPGRLDALLTIGKIGLAAKKNGTQRTPRPSLTRKNQSN